MSESLLWDRTRNGMDTRWHAQRHEDKYSKGIPDVSFGIGRRAEGWVELKFLPTAPKPAHDSTWDFKLDHFTPEQRNWLDSRLRHGTGRLFVLAQFGADLTIVWSWQRLREVLGKVSWPSVELAANAAWWHKPVNYDELVSVLADNRIINKTYAMPN